ncbi:MAG: asparagine--tRNA ligase [Candidatus Heimdallarchaeota archaeon]
MTHLPFTFIKDLESSTETIQLRGWIHHIRKQGKLFFLVLRDSTGLIQAVLKPGLTDEAALALVQDLARESVIELVGQVREDPRAPYARMEIQASSVNVISRSSPEIEHELRPDSGVDVLLDKRHLVLRGEKTRQIMHFRAETLRSFRDYYHRCNFVEVTPPTIVQTEVEGGSTLFKLKYFDEDAYLTQSSQLYLETVLPALGDCYCMLSSYRAEKSRTRRHLTEYTHLEAELAFCEFEGLLVHLEDLIVSVASNLFQRCQDLIHQLNPGFSPPQKPFRRLPYGEMIELLQKEGISKQDGSYYEWGEDVPEEPERALVDRLGEPVFLTRFPKHMKAFYMPPAEDDPQVTYSADLLLPTVGETIGASQRIHDLAVLEQRIEEFGLDLSPYYWYLDLRKYGTVPHSGYGLGIERFIQWMLNLDHIREACLYPRLINRAKP